MRSAILFSSLISIILAAGCRTQPLGDPGGGGGGNGGSGGFGGSGGAGGGGGYGGGDMAPWPVYDPDLGPWGIDFPWPVPTDMAPPNTNPVPCGRTMPDPGSGDALKHLVWAMAAHWRGVAISPWVAPYQVEVDFHPDGTYYAQTIDDSGQLPFYYDRNPEQDQYHLTNLNSDGTATGDLYLEWLTSPDQISNVQVDATGIRLLFDYYHFGYGPIHYDLGCLK